MFEQPRFMLTFGVSKGAKNTVANGEIGRQYPQISASSRENHKFIQETAMFKKILIVMFCLFALDRFCFAEGMSAEEISKALPKSYTGTYVWGISGEPWNASVSFSKVKLLENGQVEATGTEHFVGTANPEKTYDSDVRATINAQTLSFEMEEIYLGKAEGFIPMVYKGKISSDLKDIDTVWISLKGEKVSLVLKAIAK